VAVDVHWEIVGEECGDDGFLASSAGGSEGSLVAFVSVNVVP